MNLYKLIPMCLTLVCFLYASSGAEPQSSSKTEDRKAPETLNGWFACSDFPKTKPEPKLQLGSFDKCPKCPKMKPAPEYPPEAKKKRISGEVKANILFSINSGDVVWAQLEGGHRSLREAVKQVVCKVKFPPTDDVDGYVRGILTYKFALPEEKR